MRWADIATGKKEMVSTVDLTAQQRAALITVRLRDGEQLTNADIADTCGYSDWNGAQYLMESLSTVLPIFKLGGYWIWSECC